MDESRGLIKQLFCKHEYTSWLCAADGINAREGYDYVCFECAGCGLRTGEWLKKGEWKKYDFPENYTMKNK